MLYTADAPEKSSRLVSRLKLQERRDLAERGKHSTDVTVRLGTTLTIADESCSRQVH